MYRICDFILICKVIHIYMCTSIIMYTIYVVVLVIVQMLLSFKNAFFLMGMVSLLNTCAFWASRSSAF